jgi:choline monooxygenase
MLNRSLRKLSTRIAPLATSLPASAYTDPILYETERKNLLGKKWQLIAHESQLPKNDDVPASYIAETISNYPTILIRSGKTGEIKGYHNVCRHRAGPLEWDGTKGLCSIHGLKCKYHGWTYSVDGELKGVPAFGSACSEPLNKSDYNLWPMRVAVWRGLIFLQQLPDPSSTIPMSGPGATEAFVNENKAFCDRFTSVPLEEFRVHSTSTHEIKCNWKVYVENYLEGYHIPMIHPLLNSQVNMNDYAVRVEDGYVEHTTTTTQSNYEVSPSFFHSFFLLSNVHCFQGVWVWFNPSLAINCYGTGLSLERIVPTSSETTEIRYIFLRRQSPPSSSSSSNQKEEEQKLKEFQDAMEVSRVVTEEDKTICESVYVALKSGSYVSPGKLSPRHEKGVQYFQTIIRDSHL